MQSASATSLTGKHEVGYRIVVKGSNQHLYDRCFIRGRRRTDDRIAALGDHAGMVTPEVSITVE
jgi:hypothetical protein